MLVVHKVGVGQAAYYLDGRSPGFWTGTGCDALGLAGAVDRSTFVAALSGCDPDGRLLLGRRAARRRAGFDLIFGAPKSVSLLAALGDDPGGPAHRSHQGAGPDHSTVERATTSPGTAIVAAHQAAVADTLGYLERRATWTRRGAEHRRIPVSGLVAAGFGHELSWSGDPHLHTHIVVANLALGADGTWSCLDSRALYQHRQAAAAVYQASLRHQLTCSGFPLGWTVRPDGLADIAGVPRAAIEACSTRRRAILEAGDSSAPMSAAARTAAAGRTRRQDNLPADSWESRAAGAGLDRRVAGLLLTPRRSDHPGGGNAPANLAAIVDARLSATTSSFEHSDCVRLAAANLPHGAPAEAIETWATSFLDGAIPAEGRGWVTAALRQRQRHVAVLAGQPATRVGLARPDTVARALDDRPGLGAVAREAVEALTGSGAAVQRLGARPFLAQAAVLEAAQDAWEASGHRVAVITPTPQAAQRWQALCGLGPPPPGPHHASIVIVDRAERLCTAELHRILADGSSRRAKVILVEGGTAAAGRNVGPAFGQLRAILPAVEAGAAVVAAQESMPVRGGLDRTVAVAATSQDAFNALVGDWAKARGGPLPPVMVALGRDEAGALNDLARQVLAAEGVLRGPAVTVGRQEWRAGDELQVLRRHRLFGPTPAGTIGTVTSVDPAAATVTIRWPGCSMAVAAKDLNSAPASYAYATTPAYLRYRSQATVLSLGDPGRRGSHQVEAPQLYLVAHPPRMREASSGPVGQMVTELAAADPPAARASARRADRYVSWSLGQLADFRHTLGDRLTASVPPDVGPEQRRLDEERAWQRARGEGTEVLDERARTLAAAANSRRHWLETHADELGQWVAVGEAMNRRADALSVAAEARPSRTVLAEIGPQPPDERDRSQWRHAARELECFRDRWSHADDRAGLEPELAGPIDGMDNARRRDLGRVVAATRMITRDRAMSRGPPHPRQAGRSFRRTSCGGLAPLPAVRRAGELFHDVWSTTMTPSLAPPDPPDCGATSPLAGCCAGS